MRLESACRSAECEASRRGVVGIAFACLLWTPLTGAQPLGSPRAAQPAVLIVADYPNAGMSGRVAPWIAEWLADDGSRVADHAGPITAEALDDTDVLFLVCPIAEQNAVSSLPDAAVFSQAWRLPTPSAYTDEEITLLSEWVRSGGSLFVITDHCLPRAPSRTSRRRSASPSATGSRSTPSARSSRRFRA